MITSSTIQDYDAHGGTPYSYDYPYQKSSEPKDHFHLIQGLFEQFTILQKDNDLMRAQIALLEQQQYEMRNYYNNEMNFLKNQLIILQGKVTSHIPNIPSMPNIPNQKSNNNNQGALFKVSEALHDKPELPSSAITAMLTPGLTSSSSGSQIQRRDSGHKEHREHHRDHKETRDSRDARDSRDSRDARDSRDSRTKEREEKREHRRSKSSGRRDHRRSAETDPSPITPRDSPRNSLNISNPRSILRNPSSNPPSNSDSLSTTPVDAFLGGDYEQQPIVGLQKKNSVRFIGHAQQTQQTQQTQQSQQEEEGEIANPLNNGQSRSLPNLPLTPINRRHSGNLNSNNITTNKPTTRHLSHRELSQQLSHQISHQLPQREFSPSSPGSSPPGHLHNSMPNSMTNSISNFPNLKQKFEDSAVKHLRSSQPSMNSQPSVVLPPNLSKRDYPFKIPPPPQKAPTPRILQIPQMSKNPFQSGEISHRSRINDYDDESQLSDSVVEEHRESFFPLPPI